MIKSRLKSYNIIKRPIQILRGENMYGLELMARVRLQLALLPRLGVGCDPGGVFSAGRPGVVRAASWGALLPPSSIQVSYPPISRRQRGNPPSLFLACVIWPIFKY